MNLCRGLLGILPLQAEVLEVGNPLVSWASSENNEGEDVGSVVLDLGICFQFPGSVHAVRALFAGGDDAEEVLPIFVMLEHAEAQGEAVWKVTATSAASPGSPRGRADTAETI